MFQPRLFMNMEPDPLDFRVLNNSLRTDWSTKGPAPKTNQIVLFFIGGFVPGYILNSPRPILTRQLRPFLGEPRETEASSLDLISPERRKSPFPAHSVSPLRPV
jgi:hypothetical protein